ncbi:MAG: GGDEF domain-containing protein, partial [Chlorobiaceae bacterium]
LVLANQELVFQDEEKEKRAAELGIADKELVFQNEEKEKRAAELLIAMHDSLTGLPNRLLFSERVSLSFAQCQRNNTMAALLIFDLDKFKIVNDSLGHAVGDTLLQEVAARSVATLQRSTDSISRLGGDEFVILLQQIVAVSDAVTIAEKIRNNIKEPYNIEGHTINISCSIGIAIYPDHGEDELTLMKNADEAMYRAKNQGRDNVKVFTESEGDPNR